MILCSLKLENFKRYKEFEIEFSEGLTGFIGKNGSGKSTIFEAVFFALYGEIRNKNAKSYIKYVKSDEKSIVKVELIFEINSVEYKAVREFRGKNLTAKAYLYDSREILLASGAKEVDKKIQNLIGMGKTAFLHTVFASQKELMSLSLLDNEARKKMIRKLLGLEKIDSIEKKIRENLTDLRRDSKSFLEVLLKDDEEKSLNDSIHDLKNSLGKKSLDIKKVKNDYFNISNEYKNIYLELQNFQISKEQLQTLQKELSLIEQNIFNNKENINKFNNELKELKEKQNQFKEKEGIKENFQELEKSLKQQEQYKENFLKQEGFLKEQARLRVEFKRVREEIYSLNIAVKEIPSYRKKLDNLEAQIIIVIKSIEEIEKFEKKYSSDISGLNSLIAQHKNKIDNLKELGKESACPTCTRPLLNEYDKVLDMLNSEINEVYETKINAIKEKLEIEKLKYAKTLDYKNELEKNRNEISSTINLLIDKEKRLEVQKLILNDIEKVGRDNNEALSKIKDVKYDRVLHNSLIEQYSKMRVEYESVLKLEQSLENIPKLKKELDLSLDNDLKLTEQKLSTLNLIKKDKYDSKEHEKKELEYKTSAKNKEEIQSKLVEEEKEYEKVNGKLNTLKEKKSINEKNKFKLKLKQDDIDDFDKLKINIEEFKTKINSKIAPRISQISSEMYSTITKGRYQHIEVTNEFDFNIYDDGKAYPIERFSGGEIDLANLVLRIAISKTLSELSGTKKIGFLAFDEIFGSQDEARREEIMQAFSSIKEEYRQIFLISHEVEIKELFEHFVEIQ